MDANKFAAIGRKQGQVLSEFQILLDYVTQVKPRIGKKTFQLSSTSLLDLNKRLSKSLHLDLRKPQPRSFPHINALYLLFKSSGLASYTYEDNNLYLKLDSAALKKWKELSDFDKYFNLLSSWLGNGHPEIICEERLLPQSNHFLLDFYFKTLKNGLSGTYIEVHKLEAIRAEVGIYQVALLEMFNMVSIEDNNHQVSKQWNIKKIYTTEWGNLIFSLFEDFCHKTKFVQAENYQLQVRGMFKEMFSGFKADLAIIPQNIYDKGSFIFRIDTEQTWKRIQIPVHFTGLDFGQCIAEAFDLDTESSFILKAKNRFGYWDEYVHPGLGAAVVRDADDYAVGSICPNPGTNLVLEYSGGGGLHFELFCEEYLPKYELKERILETKPFFAQYTHSTKK